MYMWKNIFHVIPTWHRDIPSIFCPRHQNIPNIFVFVHKLMLTFTCSLPSVVAFPSFSHIFHSIQSRWHVYNMLEFIWKWH
jgi:hypothetical protein